MKKIIFILTLIAVLAVPMVANAAGAQKQMVVTISDTYTMKTPQTDGEITDAVAANEVIEVTNTTADGQWVQTVLGRYINKATVKEYCNNEKLDSASNLTTQDFEYILPAALKGLGPALTSAEQKYDINGVFLLAIICHETGNGLSNKCLNHNNLGGLIGKTEFSSKEECVDYMANLLKTDYVTPDGIYYRGGTIEDVNVNYCVGNDWAGYIRSYMSKYADMIVEARLNEGNSTVL